MCLDYQKAKCTMQNLYIDIVMIYNEWIFTLHEYRGTEVILSLFCKNYVGNSKQRTLFCLTIIKLLINFMTGVYIMFV